MAFETSDFMLTTYMVIIFDYSIKSASRRKTKE